MTDNETREIKQCYGNVENQIDEILATIDTIDRNEIKARLKNAALDIKKIGYCLYGWDDEKTKIIQYDEKLEEIFNYVDNNMVNAYCYFIEDDRLTENDSVMFYPKCTALGIFNMLTEAEECVRQYTCMEYGRIVRLRHVGSLISRLIVIEDVVETHKKVLLELGVNSEAVLCELRGAILKLQHFLWKYIPPVKE